MARSNVDVAASKMTPAQVAEAQDQWRGVETARVKAR